MRPAPSAKRAAFWSGRKDLHLVATLGAKGFHALEDALAVVEHRGGGVEGEVAVGLDGAHRPLAVDGALGSEHEGSLHEAEAEVVPVEVSFGSGAGLLGGGGHRGDAKVDTALAACGSFESVVLGGGTKVRSRNGGGAR